jgi:Zn-dependent protease with chaperone function
LNTVQSTLERLYKKELLHREKVSHAYIYTPKVLREELMAQAIGEVIAASPETKAGPCSPPLSIWTETVEFLKLAALAVSLFGILGSGVCAIVYPLLRNRLLALDPATRAHTLVAWSMVPCLIALALTGLCLLPWVLHFLGWSPTHCLDSHLCLSHPHQFLNGTMAWVAFALVGLLGLSTAVTQLYRLLGARRVLKALALASRYDVRRGVQVVESDWPLALTAGLWYPRVFVSSRLTISLPADMLEVAIAHERAHTRQRDSLKQLVASVFSLMHPPQVRQPC